MLLKPKICILSGVCAGPIVKRFAIDDFGHHAAAHNTSAPRWEHMSTYSLPCRGCSQAGYRTDRKNVPHSRGLKKADLLIKDFHLSVVRNVIIDVTLRHEFHGSCAIMRQPRTQRGALTPRRQWRTGYHSVRLRSRTC